MRKPVVRSEKEKRVAVEIAGVYMPKRTITQGDLTIQLMGTHKHGRTKMIAVSWKNGGTFMKGRVEVRRWARLLGTSKGAVHKDTPIRLDFYSFADGQRILIS